MTNTITIPLRQTQSDIILKNRSEYVMVSLSNHDTNNNVTLSPSKGDIIEKKTL